MQAERERERELFEKVSVGKALIRMALPTVGGQIILVIYNMADTFFVGLTGNDAMLTAVTVCMPAFMLLSAISNLFGVGGASVIARALGSGEEARGRLAAAFSFWGCLGVTLLYCLLTLLFCHPLVDLLGGEDPRVHGSAAAYLLCTVAAGGAVTAMGMLFSHLIRAEGRSLLAGIGIALGGVLNIALDPLFMFVLLPPGQEALGAAVATSLANLISLLYFLAVLVYNRQKSLLRFAPSRACLGERIPKAVLDAGVPACVMTLFENVSYAVLDKLMSFSGLELQAGLGVAKKLNMLAHSLTRGIAQGALPLLGYNYGAGNYERMHAALRRCRLLAIGLAAACMGVCLAWGRELTGLFIHTEGDSLLYGARFLRLLCVGGPFSAAAYTAVSFFQAVGMGKRSLLLALLRKGVVDIPLMFLLGAVLPVYGIVLATPFTDVICCGVSSVVLALSLRKMNACPDRALPLGSQA